MPVQLPASQQTPLLQLSGPVQLTLHEVPEQVTRPQELIPVQLIVVAAALLETSPAHARAPAQRTAHVFPLHEIVCVQESGLSQWMSHDDASHAIGPVHVPAAAHPMLHSLPLHAIPPVHEPAPTHWMMHELAALQLIVDVHEPAPVQVTAHGMPAGQTMGPVHVPAAVQSTAQVPPGSHVPMPASAQTEGHTPEASSTCASPASSLLASPASASDSVASRSASFVTLASPPGPLASWTVASAATRVPPSVSSESPPRARPQPNASNGTPSRTTRWSVRGIKSVAWSPARRAARPLAQQ